jgi:anti-sigma-K factor RskA
MGHEVFEENLALYAIGGLDPGECPALEAHLNEGCAACAAALKDYRETAGLLPHGLPPAQVPPELKARVMVAVAAAPGRDVTIKLSPEEAKFIRKPVAAARRSLTMPQALAAGLAGLAIGLAMYAWSLKTELALQTATHTQLETSLQQTTSQLVMLQKKMHEAVAQRDGDLAKLHAQLAAQEQEAATLHQALAHRDELLAFLQSASVKVVALAGSKQAKTASGLILYDPDSKKAFFYGFNLPPLQRGKTYQLWAIVDKPVNAGVFDPDSGRKGRMVTHPLPDFPRIKQFAVSVEPEGGRPQPTGSIYLVSQR